MFLLILAIFVSSWRVVVPEVPLIPATVVIDQTNESSRVLRQVLGSLATLGSSKAARSCCWMSVAFLRVFLHKDGAEGTISQRC